MRNYPKSFRSLRKKRFLNKFGKLRQIKPQHYTWKFMTSDRWVCWGRPPIVGEIIGIIMTFHSKYRAFYGYDVDRHRNWMMKEWKKPARYYKWAWNRDKI